jgi:peptide chain release factor 1
LKCLDIAEFKNEIGGHRVQELSGIGKKARIHTSTVTVSVLYENIKKPERDIPDSEFSVRFYSGTGSGGQRRNKVMSCCTVTHIPTGLTQNANGRSRIDNETEARATLKDRVLEIERNGEIRDINNLRKNQIGGGARGDKKRTYRYQDDQIVDANGKSTSLKTWMKGDVEKLW